MDIYNLKKTKKEINWDQYENFIIGSSIAYNRWTKEAKKFLSHEFNEKKIAIFVCSGNTGGVFKKNDAEGYKEFSKK